MGLPQKQDHFITIEEYFNFIKSNDGRYEYRAGEIVSMAGGTPNHSIIMVNINDAFTKQVSKCKVVPADIPVKTSHKPFRYADLSIACIPKYEEINGIAMLANPVVIVEILSNSSKAIDRKKKREEYQSIDSVTDYLIIASDLMHVVSYTRKNSVWNRIENTGAQTIINLPSVNCSISLDQIYEGVELV